MCLGWPTANFTPSLSTALISIMKDLMMLRDTALVYQSVPTKYSISRRVYRASLSQVTLYQLQCPKTPLRRFLLIYGNGIKEF